MSNRILTVSSANMDLSMRVRLSPTKGQTVLGMNYKYVSGGKGANSATAFAKLGADSVFCAAMGNDSNGSTLKALYKEIGINTDYILTLNDAPTGLATVTVEDDGASTIVVFPGANAKLDAAHAISAAKECKPDAVFAHLEIPFDTVAELSHYCHVAGIPMVIDAGPANKEYDLSKLSPMLVFSPNETETEIFTGICPEDDESILRAAKKLSEAVTAKYYVLKLGGRGVAVYDGKNVTLVPTYDVKAVDTTSAGDSFTAAMLLEYLRSGDIVRACRYGNAVASITVSRPGAGESIPDAAETEEFIKKHNITL